jgi:uncharacterized membrane protein
MKKFDSSNEDQPPKNEKKSPSFTGLGIALGASLGFILGLLLFEDNPAVGIGIGVALGLIIGSAMDARRKEQ